MNLAVQVESSCQNQHQPYKLTYPFMKLIVSNQDKPKKAIEASMYDSVQDQITNFISVRNRNQKQIVEIVRFITQDVSIAKTISDIIANVQKTWWDSQRYFELNNTLDDEYATLTLVIKNADSKKISHEIDLFVEDHWRDFAYLKGKIILATDHFTD